MGITVERVGRRLYLVGDTFQFKSQIKEAGGNFDFDDRKQWWFGSSKESEVQALVVKLNASAEAPSVGAAPPRWKQDPMTIRLLRESARIEDALRPSTQHLVLSPVSCNVRRIQKQLAENVPSVAITDHSEEPVPSATKGPMSKSYTDERYCQHCARETAHWCTDSDHERDSSADYRECLVCGWRYLGCTGRYEAPPKDCQSSSPYKGSNGNCN